MNRPFARLRASVVAAEVTGRPITPGPSKASLSPIHPTAGYAEGTEPGWMARWDMWADTLNAPKPRRDAA